MEKTWRKKYWKMNISVFLSAKRVDYKQEKHFLNVRNGIQVFLFPKIAYSY